MTDAHLPNSISHQLLFLSFVHSFSSTHSLSLSTGVINETLFEEMEHFLDGMFIMLVAPPPPFFSFRIPFIILACDTFTCTIFLYCVLDYYNRLYIYCIQRHALSVVTCFTFMSCVKKILKNVSSKSSIFLFSFSSLFTSKMCLLIYLLI